ncbi:MAG: hypothetical protein WC528_02330 [Patescibacteria group bacterium]
MPVLGVRYGQKVLIGGQEIKAVVGQSSKNSDKKDSLVRVDDKKSEVKVREMPVIKKNGELKREVKEVDGRNLPSEKNYSSLRKFKKFWKLGVQELNTEYFDINQQGVLTVKEGNNQYNIQQLVEKYGSPVEIYFPFILEERLTSIIDLFNFYIKYFKYRGKFYYHYPMKVNQNKEIILPIVSEGANLEASSYNELYLVKKLWEQGSFHEKIKVICNGPKTEKYLALIEELRNNNLSIIPIIEDNKELEFLQKYKGDVGIRVDLRTKVRSHWDKKINRYGFTEEEIKKIGKVRNLKILHYHLGSQVEYLDDIFNSVKKGMEVYVQLKKKNPSLDTLDIGGGLPIPYDRKKHYSIDSLVRKIIRHLNSVADQKKIAPPDIICEWGRFVAAPSQMTVFKILSSKTIPKGNAKAWYVIDGSFMNDLMDTWAIHQCWHVLPVNHLMASKLNRCWLAGLSCDTDDKYIAHGHYILLPKITNLKEGESLYVAFLDTGAYQNALASHHCLLSWPARLLAENGVVRQIRRHETPDDVGKIYGW